MEVLDAINRRRSIRKYKSDPVDDKTLQEILGAARVAPSWANTQCCRIIVIKDKDVKSKLIDTMFSFRGGVNQTAEGMRAAPLAIAFCAETTKSGFSYQEPKVPATDKGGYWYMFDTALAMENFVLAAQAHGLGTVIIGAFDPQAAAKVLNVPEGFAVVTLTPLGYPDESPNARPRKELSEIVSYDGFKF